MAKASSLLPRGLTRALALALLGVVLSLGMAVPKAAAHPLDGIGAAVMQLLGIGDVEPTAAFNEKKTVDPSTIAAWEDIVHSDTENIGRIWTDKTVSSTSVQLPASPDGAAPEVEIGDSDFLVALSALSSTSNITTTSSKPLDIVLVLDASGSMDEDLTSEYRYVEAYNINTNGRTTYYAQNTDGSYAEIERITRQVVFWQQFDHWEFNGETVNPKTSAQDSDPNHIQFYTYNEVTTTKMAALRDAANAFIENTAKLNDGIGDTVKQHRISLVKFASDKSNDVGNDTMGGWEDYNYSQVMTNLTAYTSDDVSSATDTIDNLTASGATSADYGMQHARTVLAGARDDAQKVVIFFTDGEPNHGNGFDSTVANDAISAAASLKGEGALVYTIGMFADADPSNTSIESTNQFNAYMHAVSSNYPQASAWNNLGKRVSQDSAYYKAATNAGELNQIFQEISDEINAGTGLPTETTEGAEGTSGYITFTDKLGAYMEADGFKSIVFADEVFSNPKKTSNGLIDTYTFEGEHAGNALYPNGNLNQVIVTVQRSNDLAQGDIVTVKVPAGLIPLRKFTVTDENGVATMDIAEAYPMRIFYGVSVKQGVYDALANGTADQALKNYIANNITDDGKTSFYSNYYDGTVTTPDGSKKLGNTTASFVPAEGNSFYYFTANTTLYTDENCTQKLMTEPHAGDRYYYKRSYYEKDAKTGAVTKRESITGFYGANFDSSKVFWGIANDGSYYITAGAPRLTRIDDLSLPKKNNATGTSTEVISPNWDNINNPDVLNVSLGNNGKIAVELPGALAITKDAGVAANKGLSTDVLNDKEFQFEITVASAADDTLNAVVKNSQGDTMGDPFTLTFDGQGKASHSIKDDETLYIYGLDANAEYTVTEVDLPAGFTQTDATGATGTIAGNETTTVTFQNTYDVTTVTVDADRLAKWEKVFDRWDLAASFYIRLSAVQANSPMPEGSDPGTGDRGVKTVQATEKSNTGTFGSITFDRPGTFDYTVSEVTPAATIPGVSYSDAAYNVRVVVTDNGEGALSAQATMTKTSTDAGQQINPGTEVQNRTAVFTNSFDANSTNAGPVASKSYVNSGGADTALKDGMFTFKVKPVGSNANSAPLPADVEKDDDGYIRVDNIGETVAFGQAAFTDAHVGQTYTYEIREHIPAGADEGNGYTLNGMKYDPTVYHAKFEVTAASDADEANVVVSTTYYKVENGNDVPIEGRVPVFSNSYDPANAVLDGETAIKVTKTLNGRASKDGEAFTFTMSAADQPTADALASYAVVLGADEATTDLTASIDGLTEATAKTVGMGKVTFTKPGTYSFNVRENAPADGEGMVYDRHAALVTVVVTDSNGTLFANVTYNNGQGAPSNSAAFVNTYSASYIYGAGMNLTVGKTLNGRAQKAEEFSFTVKGVDKKGSVAAADAEDKLADTDKSFKTASPANSGIQSQIFNKLSSLRFTQADAGKTFSYVLSEVIPADGAKLGGVTYDAAVYGIDITPVDTGNGTMHTETTINKNMADGTTELVGEYNSVDGKDAATLGFTNTYKAASVTVTPDDANLHLTKVLKGRDWAEGDEFTFKVASAADSPDAAEAEKTVTANAGTKDGTPITFNFGAIEFDAVGQYHYQVTEENGGQTIDGVTYDNHTADIYVNVTDPGTGQLEAKTTVYNTTFINVYKAELNHNAAGGIIVTKTTNGHDMALGQFQFRVETLDGVDTTAAETAQRIGITNGTTGDFGNVEGKDGVKVEMPSEHPITFTQADVGKTFKLKISERGADGATFGSGGTAAGYTYDDAVYTVELSVADKGDGTLELTTKVTDKKGSETTRTSSAADKHATYLNFVNSYNAGSVDVGGDSEVQVEGVKELSGRPMNNGEFEFDVYNAMDVNKEVVATGANDASGKITFSTLAYNRDKLKDDLAKNLVSYERDGRIDVYTYVYKIVEKETSQLGLSFDQYERTFSVKISDANDGTDLKAEVTYPDGDIVFKNEYGNAEGASLTISGTKVVASVDGAKVPDYVEKYTFELTGELGAPMPAEGGNFAKNQASGQVQFGPITFTMDEVFGSSDVRERSFKYYVTETGSVPGIDNDLEITKTITVTVKDNLDGTISVIGNPDDMTFTFTNTYETKGESSLTGEGNFVITKELNGRALNDGEFEFKLNPVADGEALTAKNGADGKVAFPAIDFTQPGEYKYTLFEVDGKLDGVTYDKSVYDVSAAVTDNGDGTLSVVWSVFEDGAKLDGNNIVFTNTYSDSVVPGPDPDPDPEPEPEPEPEPTPDPDKPSDPDKDDGDDSGDKLVQTGDATMAAVAAAAVAGIAAIGAGAIARRKNK